jgi:hypothetical protein
VMHFFPAESELAGTSCGWTVAADILHEWAQLVAGVGIVSLAVKVPLPAVERQTIVGGLCNVVDFWHSSMFAPP